MNEFSFIEFIHEVERKYKVNDVLVNGVKIWPALRYIYWRQYRRTELIKDQISITKKAFQKKRYIYHDFLRLLRKYDYIVFSNTTNRKKIDGNLQERFVGPIIKRIGYNRTLFVESTSGKDFDYKRLCGQRIISADLFNILEKRYKKIFTKNLKVQNYDILEDINKSYNLNINYLEYIKRFWVGYKIKRLFFRIYRPKAIFVVCYYSYSDVIKAAKDLGIKVIEVQHGAIGKVHPSYNINIELDRSFFPDFLLAFGENDVEILKNSKFVGPCNIIPVGSFYLEYMKKRNIKINGLDNLPPKYKRKVGVTTQSTLEKQLIDFLLRAANLDRDILYVFISRDKKKGYNSIFSFPENIVIIDDFNFYEIIKYMDFHATVCSTCALEAPSLGVQNILIDINGFAKKYYADILTDNEITRYVSTPEEFVYTIKNFRKLDKDYISKTNEHIFKMSYNENIQRFIELSLNQQSIT